jgi:hypothetical protein
MTRFLSPLLLGGVACRLCWFGCAAAVLCESIVHQWPALHAAAKADRVTVLV